VGPGYAERARAAGGMPVLLPPLVDEVGHYLELCRGFVLTGGDDPEMEHWGVATHAKATMVDSRRQAFEIALLEGLETRPEVPVLGVCLGMQYMALQGGGMIDQYLPDSLATAAGHWGKREHAVKGALGAGMVHSHHRQAVNDPGEFRVVAAAPDGVIEAIEHPDYSFRLGVQWHPERTALEALGSGLFRRLVEATISTRAPVHSG